MAIGKYLLLGILFISSLYAESVLQTNLMNILGPDSYRVNQKFLQRIFKNERRFFDSNQQIDLLKVNTALKDNGLLKLNFKKPQELEIAFSTYSSPIASSVAIMDTLKELGYHYFFIKQGQMQQQSQGNLYKIIISMSAESAIDPTLFEKRLRLRGFRVDSIMQHNIARWEYEISLFYLKSKDASVLQMGDNETRGNIRGAYWFVFDSERSMIASEENTFSKPFLPKGLEISSGNFSKWYPKISFFDENMNLIEVVRATKSTASVKVDVPSDCVFVKVSDSYVASRLKSGLKIKAYK